MYKCFYSFLGVFLLASSAYSQGVDIEFYNDQGRCDVNKLVFKQTFTGDSDRDLKLCKFIVANLESPANIWGVKVGGTCIDINDMIIGYVCERAVDAIQTGTKLR